MALIYFRRFVRHRLALVGLVVLILLAGMALCADLLVGDPNAIHANFRSPPSNEHILGTDFTGRDVLSRLVHASRVSLVAGLGTALLSVSIGGTLGLIAGYYRGVIDSILMRFTDMVLSFPSLVLILVVVSVVGPSIRNVILVLGLLGWPTTARLVRAEVLSLRERDFVLAARTIGSSDLRIMTFHLLPNALTPILIAGTLTAAFAILAEATLSFLGLGVQPPQASWGNMLSSALSLSILNSMPWLWLPPGLMIFITVLSINFVGDGIRDALDPRTLIGSGQSEAMAASAPSVTTEQ